MFAGTITLKSVPTPLIHRLIRYQANATTREIVFAD